MPTARFHDPVGALYAVGTKRIALLTLALVLASCLRHARVQAPPEKAPPLAPSVTVDLEGRSTVEASRASRPAWVEGIVAEDDASYAPQWADRYPHLDRSVSAPAPLGPLDRELLLCEISGSAFGEWIGVKRGRDAAELARRWSSVGDGRVALPLWSMEPGESISFAIRARSGPVEIATGTYEGHLPLEARGPAASVSCAAVARSEIERVTTAYFVAIERDLSVHEWRDDMRVRDPDPLRDAPLLAESFRYLREAACLLGWSHPLVVRVGDALHRAVVDYRAKRAQLFLDGRVLGAVGVPNVVKRDNLEIEVTSLRCTASRPAVVSGATIYDAPKKGCAAELRITNHWPEPLLGSAVEFLLVSPSRTDAFAYGSIPPGVSARSLLLPVDPTQFTEPTMIVVCIQRDEEIVLVRVH